MTDQHKDAELILTALAKAKRQGDLMCADIPIGAAMRRLATSIVGEARAAELMANTKPTKEQP